jgi:hypothetical protein
VVQFVVTPRIETRDELEGRFDSLVIPLVFGGVGKEHAAHRARIARRGFEAGGEGILAHLLDPL